ncbi:MAG: hypothetical protein ACREQX_20060, partial [Candidatus Binataceae bacterium]
HVSPVDVTLSDNGNELSTKIVWFAPDERTIGAWANATDATEAGAYCCVIAGVEETRRLYAIRRAETLIGADYYVGPTGTGVNDLEDCLRLEVSGVDAGDRHSVRQRLGQKIRQAREGKSSLPAIAGVFAFSATLLMVQDVPEES